MIVILGSGPSGLVAANYLKYIGEDFILISDGSDNFSPLNMYGTSFTLGQRTLFYSDSLYEFIHSIKGKIATQDLTDKISVNYQGKLHNYPIQNNMKGFSIWDKINIWWSYIIRDKRKAGKGNYADWVLGNYGEWLANNVILPHTYKTLKEDLYTINSNNYGKKVIGLNLWGKSDPVKEILNPQKLFKQMLENVCDKIIKGRVVSVLLESQLVEVYLGKKGTGGQYAPKPIRYDKLINTIALPKFVPMLEPKTSILTISEYSLRWNNLFVGVIVVPTSFIKTDKNIVYFPEREYIFSKVYFQKQNGYTVITCEHSFRRNDKNLYREKIYQDKILERMEDDLKKSGLVKQATFLSYGKVSHIISPAYIVCDEEYDTNNSFIQNFLEHHNIYNIGRFSEWKPNLRVEHSIERMKKLGDKLLQGGTGESD